MIGDIKSHFWRRAGMIFIGIPVTMAGVLPGLIWHFPGITLSALAEAWDGFSAEFAHQYSGANLRLLKYAWIKCWSEDWTNT